MINNLPTYAENYKYIIATQDENFDYWFYGAWNDGNKANEVAMEINGSVFEFEKTA